jgi:hypothetical protein
MMFAVRPLLLILVLLAIAVPSMAQTDTILPNPKAVRLHRIWLQTGNYFRGGDEVGDGAGSVGDINNDSLEDFAVAFGALHQWRLYRGGSPAPDTIPFWTFDSSGGFPGIPVVGDFWGTGHKAVGFMRGRAEGAALLPHYWLHIFRTESHHLGDSADLVWDSEKTGSPPDVLYPSDVIAADLDGDHADELIIVNGGINMSNHAEIWIYKGGSNFQVDTPTVVIRDPEEDEDASNYFAAVGDFDGDGHLDLASWGQYPFGVSKAHFFFGSDGSPWNWTLPDRVITGTIYGFYPGLSAFDCDGDHVTDLTIGEYLYRSGSGKNARTRSFSADDADRQFHRYGYYMTETSGGYLNDSSRRYAMMILQTGGDNAVSTDLLFFGGGPNGPNLTYDAYYRPEDDNLPRGFTFGYRSDGPLHDCNGDGWDDFIIGDRSYGPFNSGIAMILAGGPYIPNDDPSLGVQEDPLENHTAGLSLWPNPVHDKLNIAWRGDLKQMPERFEVHGLSGKLVASGVVQPSLGAASWRCTETPAGWYVITAYDASGATIASTAIIKR